MAYIHVSIPPLSLCSHVIYCHFVCHVILSTWNTWFVILWNRLAGCVSKMWPVLWPSNVLTPWLCIWNSRKFLEKYFYFKGFLKHTTYMNSKMINKEIHSLIGNIACTFGWLYITARKQFISAVKGDLIYITSLRSFQVSCPYCCYTRNLFCTQVFSPKDIQCQKQN